MRMLFWLGIAALAAGICLVSLYRKKFAKSMEEKIYAYLSGGACIAYGIVMILWSYHPDWFT